MKDLSELQAQLDRSLIYLRTFDSALSDAVEFAAHQLQWELDEVSADDLDLLVNDESVLAAVRQTSKMSLLSQCKSPSRVMMQRLQAVRQPMSVAQLFDDLIDSETLVTTAQLQSLQEAWQPVISRRDKIRFESSLVPPHVLLIGSFCLINFEILLEQSNLRSLVLLESDPAQLAAALSLFDFKSFVVACREHNIRFNLLFDEKLSQKSGAKARILDHFASNNPAAFHALAVFRSPVLDPDLIQAAAWMEAPDGFLDLAKGYLGNDTDEFNQVLHALYSGLSASSRPVRLLERDIEPHDHPLVLVASGPSLDDQLSWLQKSQDELTILASGSSLGALLRAGIRPDGVVLLEMSSIVYQDLLDLVSEGYDLKPLVAAVSATVDPRIISLFTHCAVFHRPLSSALCLYPHEQSAALPQAGPQAANAAVEVALRLGFRNLLLVGCDFGTADRSQERARDAMGVSPRDFNLPVAGGQGKTIFSNAELSSTRQLFEHALYLYGANAVAVGQGSLLKGVQHWQGSLDDLIPRYSSTAKSVLQDIVNDFPFRQESKEDLFVIISEARSANKELLSLLKVSLNNSKSLDHSVISAWNDILSWSDQEATPGQRLNRRLIRFLVFFALQPLVFDLPDSPDWQHRLSPVLESLSQVEEVYSVYYDLLEDILKFKVIPKWDSAWLKRRIIRRIYG